MLGPDYEFVLSDGEKSSYCMEVRNCSEDDVCMASLLTCTHTHTHTHTYVQDLPTVTISHSVTPKDQLGKRRYMVLGYGFVKTHNLHIRVCTQNSIEECLW